MDSLLETNRADLCDYSIWFLENARKSTRRDYLDSIETAVSMYNRFGPLMDEYDIFVCPTLMTTGVPNDSTWPENEIEVNGKIRKVSEEHWSATFPFNMLSRCPVMSMPSGLASNGVPTAIQFVARSFDDQRVFSAALAYEKAFKLPPYQLDQRVACGE
jgi:Asp-tRNA(Asn)/Glu-tRNA(Gln) amidotransferase A subunit family amidase